MITLEQIRRITSLFKRAFGFQKKEIAALVFLSFFSGILGGVGIGAIIPLFSFVQGGVPGTDAISRLVETIFSFLHIPFTLPYLVAFIITLFVIKGALLFYINYIATSTVLSFEEQMRKRLFTGTFRADWSYLSKHKLGHLDQLLTTYVSKSSAPLFYFGGAIIVIANLVVYIALALQISAIATLLALLTGTLVMFFFKPFFRKNAQLSQEMSKIGKHFGHFVNESVLGLKTVKSMRAEQRIIEKAEGFFRRINWLNIHVTIVRTTTNVLLEPLSVVFILGVFLYFMSVQESVNLGSFAVIVYAIHKIFSQGQTIQSDLHSVISSIPFLEAVLLYEEEAGREREQDLGEVGFQFTKTLRFDNVDFSYRDGIPVLRKVSFTLPKGGVVGLIGPSGAGKTTLVDLILRLYGPKEGHILLDDADIASVRLQDWRRNIGYVSQEIFLLNDTIENNIRFYYDAITDTDLKEAAKMANIHDFIESLPEKWQTVVGERGILLSGGQRQRIILARVLARRPQILILDEATSALDAESELLIQQAIEELRGKVTVLVIAHRLSTVKAVDTLMVLGNGCIVEEGTPDELLLDKDSYFFRVYNLRT